SQSRDNYISFDGGNEKGTYYLGLGYLDDDGLILGSGFQRYSGKFGGTYNITDNFKIKSNVLYSHSHLDLSPLGDNNTVFRRFAGQPPTSRTYDNNPDGSLSDVLNPGTNSGFGNPLYYQDKFIRKNQEQRFAGSIGFEWNVFDDFLFKLDANHLAITNRYDNFNKAYLNAGTLITTRNASASLQSTLRDQVTATASYAKSLDKHNFDLLVGGEYYRDKYYTMGASTKNSPTDLIPTMNAGSEADGVPSSFGTESVIVS